MREPNDILSRFSSGLFQVGIPNAIARTPSNAEKVQANLIEKWIKEVNQLTTRGPALNIELLNRSSSALGLRRGTIDVRLLEENAPTVLLLISHEEHQLRPFLEHLSFVRVCHLKTGDLVIVKNNHVVLVVERKTTLDLLSSIRTQRFQHQRQRLSQMKQPSITIGLLHEAAADVKAKLSTADFQLMTSSLHRTLYCEEMQVFTTEGLLDTVLWCVAQVRAHLKYEPREGESEVPEANACPVLMKTTPDKFVGPGTFLCRSASNAIHMSAFRGLGLLANWRSVRSLCAWVESIDFPLASETIANLPYLSEKQLRRKRKSDCLSATSTLEKNEKAVKRTKIGVRAAHSLLVSLGFSPAPE
jgi:hypothetical protein